MSTRPPRKPPSSPRRRRAKGATADAPQAAELEQTAADAAAGQDVAMRQEQETVAIAETAALSHRAEDRLPTPPPEARSIFVLVGMHRSGASVLAKLLQLLGVDMTEAGGDEWERPEIAAFNDRLLAAIGRPLAGAAHALPFPPGWWSDPRVLAIKREVQAYLRDTLRDRYGLWGFKDLRVTRLLPFWQQVFDEMGLRPIYIWAVRDPAECAASAVAAGIVANAQIAEAMWFIYNADAHKYLGDEAAATVDFTAWHDAPIKLVEALLDELPLSWRGSRAELLECLRAITPEARTRAGRSSPIHSPLVQAFYEAVRDPERSEKSLRTRDSMTQAVDILRTLIAPFANLAVTAVPLPMAPDLATPATASQPAPDRDKPEVAELRARIGEAEAINDETMAALANALARLAEAEAAREAAEEAGRQAERLILVAEQLEDAHAAAIGRAEQAEAARAAAVARAEQAEAAMRETGESLAHDMEERVAENGWLQQQFLDQKRALALLEEQRHQAAARTDAETQRMRQALEIAVADNHVAQRTIEDLQAAAERARELTREELERLRRDLAQEKLALARAKEAGETYLSRIYELKGVRATNEGDDAQRAGVTA